ncbi:MAG: thioredoxin-dependent thiol peroxidase [Flavobacteriales bacterium]|nr:thioredoxin-dependent thiol peroxidase [Flavobacteriales bacterium]
MTTLNKGDKAPDFDGIDEQGNQLSLSGYKGKKLILYFYPKDLTPGCTVESCNLRDNYANLLKTGFDVVGVSADDEKKHLKFIDKHELPFHLLADVDKKVINDYGVWGPKKFMGRVYDGIHRTTFIIDENGMIEKIIKKVNTKEHTQQILAELAN